MLARTIGTHPLEDYSYEMANYLNKVVSICVTSFLVLEIIFYNIYATKVKREIKRRLFELLIF